MKKKVLLLGYVRKNVGDDLFIAMLLTRYKNVQFLLRTDDISYCEPFKHYNNCDFLITKDDILKQDMTDICACIYVGGSIFIEYDKSLKYRENFNKFLKNCKSDGIAFFYMSSNFGPYKTQEFYDSCMEAFSIIEGITFRDKKSYEEFSQVETASYVPDLVFGLNIRKGRKIKNSIGISLVDLSLPVRGKAVNDIEPKYCNMLINNIINFVNNGKKVYLFSFCEHEGDLRTIDKILLSLNDKERQSVIVVDYKGTIGNLYDFVHLYSRMEKTICTRFHSLVMSLIFKHELVVVSYSNKLNNLLNDLEYDFKVVNIDENIEKIYFKDSEFKKIEAKVLNSFRTKAINHFSKLDNVLDMKKKKRKLKIKKSSFKSRIINSYYKK